MGAVFLAGYVAAIGVATYLLKVSLEDLGAYQVNLLMGVAMVAVSVPAVLLADRTLRIPGQHLPLGALVAVLMAVGSILYALALDRLPAGPTAAIATSYVIVVVVLSAVFLDEPVDLVTVAGVGLTLAGVALLSFRT
jgi:drug/metabolite transporter (DMT)-like permease